MDSGITYLDWLRYIEALYNNKKKDKVYAKKKIIEVIPELKGVDVFAMGWDKLEKSFQQSKKGKFCCKVETFPIDLTMMRQDYNMFTGFLKCSLDSCFIYDSYYTQIQKISSFLQSKPEENEVRILCIIGHGLTQQQAEELNENPPKFDNKNCKDSRKMKSRRWKWTLANCNDKKGLGKGYTARSVCKNAKKGDVVVFSSGFLTPEWIVKQLRKRERNKVHGKIPFTLVLLVDSCYSGVWTERIKTKLERVDGFQNTRLIVQTSCAADEESYGQYFIPLWCALQKESNQEKYAAEEELDFKQTPTCYDSHGSKPIEGLKFFPTGHLLRQKFRDCTDEQSRAIGNDLLKDICLGKGRILSYKLKHHAVGTPQAFFLVEINSKKIYLHIHFNDFRKFIVTQTNLYEAILYEAPYYRWHQKNYVYEEAKETREEHHIEENLAKKLTKRCSDHVGDQWLNKNYWGMSDTIPPKMIRSRSTQLESCDPTNITEQATLLHDQGRIKEERACNSYMSRVQTWEDDCEIFYF